jgi:phosphoribosyl 1,2-cyclic phosphodiesterase
MMLLRFWGVRGSIATPGPTTLEYGGNTSCLEMRAGGKIIILDAGTGLRLLGQALLAEFGDQPLELALLLSHTHWDHIQGLPFFPAVYKPRNRVRVLGYEGARKGLHAVLNNQMEHPFFPIELPPNVCIEELKDLNFNLGQVQVRATYANHPGVCVGYRLFASGRSIAFFPDNELRHDPFTEPDSEGVDELWNERTRAQNRELTAFLRGTDVLVMDTQYDREEYRTHMGWGHGCVDEVVMLALEAEVRQLFLFHHDPDHDDQKISSMVDEARELVARHNGSLQVEAAREGLAVELPALDPVA